MRFRRFGRWTWLALLAIAAHVVLSAVHTHHHEQPPDAGAMASSPSSDAPTNPNRHAPDDDDEGTCPICWALSVANTTVLTAVFILAAIAAVRIPVPAPRGEFRWCRRPAASFQARGPPICELV